MADFDVLITHQEVLHLISKPHQWTHTLHSCRLEGSKNIEDIKMDSYGLIKITILVHFGKTWVNPFVRKFENLQILKPTNYNTKTYQIVPNQRCTNNIIKNLQMT